MLANLVLSSFQKRMGVNVGVKPGDEMVSAMNTAELDFLYEEDGDIIPVEVKAASNTQAKSFKQFCKKYRPRKGYKLSLKNLAVNDCEGTSATSLPLYLAWKM